MKEVHPTPSITWGEKSKVPRRVNELETCHDLGSFLQKLSYHFPKQATPERRRELFSQIEVQYGGRAYNISEDLMAFFRDEPISGNKRAQAELKRFFAFNFPEFPTSSRAEVPQREQI